MANEAEFSPRSPISNPHPQQFISSHQPLLLIAGPSAVGKSAVALQLAEKLGGEIISVDSMQVYRGLDIGTAKPSAAELARVPHHLIDVVGLSETFNAAHFVQLAHTAVSDIQTRGRLPILCGGTGFYFKAFLEGLGDAPPSDPSLRSGLEAVPLPDLLSELAQRDPVTYEKIDRQNPRRIVRALEVIRLTGKPFSIQRKWTGASRLAPSACLIGLSRPSGELCRRIESRVEEMFQNGLVAETEALLACSLAANKTAMQALGYRQVVEHLRGQRSLPETINLVKIRTRQFAKRQLTWFRRQLQLSWIEINVAEAASSTAQRIEREFSGKVD